jgi:hypothetical protein
MLQKKEDQQLSHVYYSAGLESVHTKCTQGQYQDEGEDVQRGVVGASFLRSASWTFVPGACTRILPSRQFGDQEIRRYRGPRRGI